MKRLLGSSQRTLRLMAGASLLYLPLTCTATQDALATQVRDTALTESGQAASTPPSPVPLPDPQAGASSAPGDMHDETTPVALPDPGNHAIAAAVADGVSTQLAFSAGAVEANGMAASFPLVALTGAKILLVKYAETLPEEEKRLVMKTSSATWGGAAINNLLVWAAAPPPVPIVAGIIMGLILWRETARGYEHADRLAAAQNEKLPLAQLPANLDDKLTLAP